MDFFEAQDQARRKTGTLVFYFVMAVALMIMAIYFAVLLIFSFAAKKGANQPIDWIQPELFLIVLVSTLLVIFLGSLYKIAEMRAGGSAVALMLGGRRIQPTTTDLDERRVLNVVEEMAIAAGVAVPPVFLLKDEPSINAFAAGYTPDDAVIGVSQGSLNYLTRDELQGVIAHEFSHILNGDMRFNLRLIGILHGILLISIIGFHLLRVQGGTRVNRGREGGGGQVMLIGLAALVIGYLGLIFGRLIKSAVSRQREYLADASAVQFTRNPDSIAGALKKIGSRPDHSIIRSPNAETASHLFFGDAFPRWAHSPFATHPPLDKRIRRLDPNFDGTFPELQPLRRQPKQEVSKPAAKKTRSPLGVLLAGIGMSDRVPLDPAVIIATIGAPTMQHVQYSHELLQSIPEALQIAIREVFTARAFIFAILLDSDTSIRSTQLELIKSREGDPTLQEVTKLAVHAEEIAATARLPVLEIVQGTLRELSPPQYEQFRETVDQLVKADQKISLFEFVLQRIVIRHLDRVFELATPPIVRYHSVNAIKPDAAVLVSALAHLGHTDDDLAQRIYGESMHFVDAKASHQILPKSECGLVRINQALDRISECSAAIKKRVLTAAALCVSADQKVTVKEAELLRAMSSAIDCPIPPIIAGEIKRSIS